MSRYWKFLNADLTPAHGSGQWVVGQWWTVTGDVVPCKNGIHAATESRLVDWIAPSLHPIALDGEIVVCPDKVVARSGCIGPALPGWNERTMRLFAADCAAHVEHHAPDARASAAIIVARARAFALVGPNVWAAAGAAAWDAARVAAGAAARDAAGVAAGAAAWDAARVAAGAAAWAAAWDAAWDAAGAAARDAEKSWQGRRLLAYACGGIDLDACRAQTVAALPEALKVIGVAT